MRRRRTLLGPPPGRRLALFIDDVNMPALEQFGASPPIELLRQLLDAGGMHDRHKLFWKEVVDIVFIAACVPPGGGRQALPNRFVRHHHLLCVAPPGAEAMRRIYGAIVGGFLDGCNSKELRGARRLVVESTIDLYFAVQCLVYERSTQK